MNEILQGAGSVLLGFVLVGWLVLWIWTLMDSNKYSEEEWRAAGESKTTWLLLIVVFQFFGTLFYLLQVRPKLQASSGE
jgi:H+/Cl- antiporter ClcA